VSEHDPDDMQDDEHRFCSICGSSELWVECDNCGGDGHFDAYEDDPLWYDPGDTNLCTWCLGTGGHWVCCNASKHPAEAEKGTEL